MFHIILWGLLEIECTIIDAMYYAHQEVHGVSGSGDRSVIEHAIYIEITLEEKIKV